MQDQKGDSEKRFQELLAFSLGMMNGEDAKSLIDQYKETWTISHPMILSGLRTDKCKWASTRN